MSSSLFVIVVIVVINLIPSNETKSTCLSKTIHHYRFNNNNNNNVNSRRFHSHQIRGFVFSTPDQESQRFRTLLMILDKWLVVEIDTQSIVDHQAISLPSLANGTIIAHRLEEFWPQLNGLVDDSIEYIYQQGTTVYFQRKDGDYVSFDWWNNVTEHGHADLVLRNRVISYDRTGGLHSFYPIEADNVSSRILFPYVQDRSKLSHSSYHHKRLLYCCASNDWSHIYLTSTLPSSSDYFKPVTDWHHPFGFNLAGRFYIFDDHLVYHFADRFESNTNERNYIFQELNTLTLQEFIQCSPPDDTLIRRSYSLNQSRIDQRLENICLGFILLELIVLGLTVVYLLRQSLRITETYRTLFVLEMVKEQQQQAERIKSKSWWWQSLLMVSKFIS